MFGHNTICSILSKNKISLANLLEEFTEIIFQSRREINIPKGPPTNQQTVCKIVFIFVFFFGICDINWLEVQFLISAYFCQFKMFVERPIETVNVGANITMFCHQGHRLHPFIKHMFQSLLSQYLLPLYLNRKLPACFKVLWSAISIRMSPEGSESDTSDSRGLSLHREIGWVFPVLSIASATLVQRSLCFENRAKLTIWRLSALPLGTLKV